MNKLNRSQMRSVMGGWDSIAGDGGDCGKCNNPGGDGTTGCYKQSGGPTDGQCRCMFQTQSCS